MIRVLKGLMLTSLLLALALALACSRLDKPTEGEPETNTWFRVIELPNGGTLRDATQLADGRILVLYSRDESPDSVLRLLTAIDSDGTVLGDFQQMPDPTSTIVAVEASADGNVFTLGRTSSSDLTVKKHASNGDIIWQSVFDMPDARLRLRSSPDGGCYVFGSKSWPPDECFMKIESGGELSDLIETGLYAHQGGNAYLPGVTVLSDGSFLYAGAIQRDWNRPIHPALMHARFDDTNFVLSIIDSIEVDWLWAMVSTESGALLLYERYEYIMLNVDDKGGVVSVSRMQNSYPFPEIIDIEVTSDGHVVGCGTSRSLRSRDEFYYFKMTTDGRILWRYSKGSYAPDDFVMVFEAPDQGYVFIGRTKSPDRVDDTVIILKTDANGRY